MNTSVPLCVIFRSGQSSSGGTRTEVPENGAVASHVFSSFFANTAGPIETVERSFAPVGPISCVPCTLSVSFPPVWNFSTSVPIPRLDVDFSCTVASLSSWSSALYVI